jgi:hypothetical protein
VVEKFIDDELELLSGDKYVVVTRVNRTRYPGRLVTAFSAIRLARAVEAVARGLTQGLLVRELAGKFGDGNRIPRQFQALFKVNMSTVPGGERSNAVTVEKVYPLDHYHTEQSNRRKRST